LEVAVPSVTHARTHTHTINPLLSYIGPTRAPDAPEVGRIAAHRRTSQLTSIVLSLSSVTVARGGICTTQLRRNSRSTHPLADLRCIEPLAVRSREGLFHQNGVPVECGSTPLQLALPSAAGLGLKLF